MSDQYVHEPMLDMFIFETSHLLEQLEKSVLAGEKSKCFTTDSVNEIFRIMHTIKGSSAMMLFNSISTLAHTMEDLFYFIREEKPQYVDYSVLSDLVLEGVDFIKIEVEKIKNGDPSDGDARATIENIANFLCKLKQGSSGINPEKMNEDRSAEKQHYYISQNKTTVSSGHYVYQAILRFDDGCEMENIRAYMVIHGLKEISDELYYTPEDIIDNDESVHVIREHGFKIFVRTDFSYEKMHDFLMETVFLKELELIELEQDKDLEQLFKPHKNISGNDPIKLPKLPEPELKKQGEKETVANTQNQSIISVNVAKLDKLMDLVGEMVIAEAMVTQNPDLAGLELDNFQKAARQLHKITSEIQDMVMAIRMVPLSNTFQKMNRIVRDMGKKLDKEVNLQIIGEETEVDKNIIEHISDPLMHLVRNAIDHGIEATEDRVALGKPKAGTLILEAKNAGSDVLVLVKDDGRGLNKEKILKRAAQNGLLHKAETEMTDKEIYNLIFLPGFSTKENITEFSGRGVGMDVVSRNIEAIGGSVAVDSLEGCGTTITIKIPLTLAIIDGMNIKVGSSNYTIPTTAIKESFRPKEKDILQDPDSNEMVMVRGQCYPILRLHEIYRVKAAITQFSEGILIMVEQDGQNLCIFADRLLGQQQVVVKALPGYIKSTRKIKGLAGCTLLGDGSISLILDIASLIN